ELSVAMPFAGGPLAYGRRAVGPWFGFRMGWSMFLECLCATVGTAIAAGGCGQFLINLSFRSVDQVTPAPSCVRGTLTRAPLLRPQRVGAHAPARRVEGMTYVARLGLVWFWVACIPGVRLERIFTDPIVPFGWEAVLKAIPFAIWWLVILETVALAAEEVH